MKSSSRSLFTGRKAERKRWQGEIVAFSFFVPVSAVKKVVKPEWFSFQLRDYVLSELENKKTNEDLAPGIAR